MTSGAADARLALRVSGVLRTFNEAGVLSAADVHVARRFGRLGAEDDDSVLLAAALAVRAVRGGSVCITLAEAPAVVDAAWSSEADDSPEDVDVPSDAPDLPWPDEAAWSQACRRSPLVALGRHGDPSRPLRWVDGRVYLDRYWRQEQVVRSELDDRVARAAPPVDAAALQEALHRVFVQPRSELQQLAAAVAATSRITVLTGGPGTGKTTTVARLLAVLLSLPDGPRRVALAAPTGKAAARLQEAVREEAAALPSPADRVRVGLPTASTVHRLLGWKPGSSTRFAHDRGNRLPHELVVVDETSMVSLTLMSRLLEALRPQARLVLVGDPDQLASVEAGAVLGDLVARPVGSTAITTAVARAAPGLVPVEAAARAALGGGVVRLQVVHRFGGAIAQLAEAVRRGDPSAAVEVLTAGHPDVHLVVGSAGDTRAETFDGVRADVVAAATVLTSAARRGDVPAALDALERHRLLLAHRRGPAGVARWTAEVSRWLADAGLVPGPGGGEEGEWYRGRPVLVTSNDRDTGLSNGDTGVVVDDGSGGVVVAFGAPAAPLLVRPHRLHALQTVHAMTVHRGQGSQFAHVSLVLPAADSPLLTRELFYTAVTRARELVRVVGTEEAVHAAVERPVRRASGLRHPVAT